jgi:cytochrome c-type biogenesis protein
MKNNNLKLKNLLIFLFVVFLLFPNQLYATDNSSEAVIYYSQYCTGCAEYKDELVSFLEESGFNVSVKDYISDKNVRLELKDKIDNANIPAGKEGHLMAFIGDNIILGGHTPLDIIKDLLESRGSFGQMYVLQDLMHGDVKFYEVWSKGYEMKKYNINEPVSEYLNFIQDGSGKGVSGAGGRFLLPAVLTTGLIDGVNPCAIAVLIFFIAFLFTLKRSFKNIFLLGAVYIFVIYLTYLGIGLGLFKAIVISGQPHLMAKVGSWLMIGLGVISLKNYFLPRLPGSLKIPKFSQATLTYWLRKATLPAVIVAAFLVGLCTFPCSGGIYVAIVGLLAAKTTFIGGFGYLLLYNLMFVVPLVILLLGVANRPVLAKMAGLHQKSERLFNLFFGVIMVLIGIVILLFFI